MEEDNLDPERGAAIVRPERNADGREVVGGMWVSDIRVTLLTGGRPGFCGFARVELNRMMILEHIAIHRTREGAYFLRPPIQSAPEDGRDPFYYFRFVGQGEILIARICRQVVAKIESFSKVSSNPFSKAGFDRRRAAKSAPSETPVELDKRGLEPQSDPGAVRP